MDGSICSAIQNKFLIQFDYEGTDRVIEPHCYGVLKNGNEAIRGYQVRGYSSSGKMGWKMFDLSKTTNLEVLEETFEDERDGYQRNDKQMERIFCQL
jgi:predicted DNA-binding transcriptional regulator YafY